MEICKFSEKTNLSIDTLRYYDKIGLLVPKRKNNIRNYDEQDLIKAKGIAKLKNAGFTLTEIDQIMRIDDSIDENFELNDETKEKILTMLELLKIKQDEILQREQEIIQVKMQINRMVSKASKLLEIGHLFDENEVSLENTDKK